MGHTHLLQTRHIMTVYGTYHITNVASRPSARRAHSTGAHTENLYLVTSDFPQQLCCQIVEISKANVRLDHNKNGTYRLDRKYFGSAERLCTL